MRTVFWVLIGAVLMHYVPLFSLLGDLLGWFILLTGAIILPLNWWLDRRERKRKPVEPVNRWKDPANWKWF